MQATRAPAVTIRTDFPKTMADRGYTTNAQIAHAIGVDPSTVGRTLRGETAPSTRFVAGVLTATGGKFEDFFTTT